MSYAYFLIIYGPCYVRLGLETGGQILGIYTHAA
jgi:hypothetical protein